MLCHVCVFASCACSELLCADYHSGAESSRLDRLPNMFLVCMSLIPQLSNRETLNLIYMPRNYMPSPYAMRMLCVCYAMPCHACRTKICVDLQDIFIHLTIYSIKACLVLECLHEISQLVFPLPLLPILLCHYRYALLCLVIFTFCRYYIASLSFAT